MEKQIQDFLTFLQVEKNASGHTTKNYRIDLREFCQFSGKKGLADIQYQDIRSFLALLKSRSFSKNSIARKLACIRSFFKYLARENLLKTNPAAGLAVMV